MEESRQCREPPRTSITICNSTASSTIQHPFLHSTFEHTHAQITTEYLPFRRTSFARRSFSTAAPDLVLAATCCVKLRLSLLSNPDLKLICFLLLSVNCSTLLFRQQLCSRLTALQHFINFYYYYYYYYNLVVLSISYLPQTVQCGLACFQSGIPLQIIYMIQPIT